jgi:hypothetical protein
MTSSHPLGLHFRQQWGTRKRLLRGSGFHLDFLSLGFAGYRSQLWIVAGIHFGLLRDFASSKNPLRSELLLQSLILPREELSP